MWLYTTQEGYPIEEDGDTVKDKGEKTT